MSSIHYKPSIRLYNCNSQVTKSLGPLACGMSRSGGKKSRTYKGGSRCFVPPNPTPSSYWPGPSNPAPPNPIPPTPCQFPHFRPLVLSQFGGKTKRCKRKCCVGKPKTRVKNCKRKCCRRKTRRYKK